MPGRPLRLPAKLLTAGAPLLTLGLLGAVPSVVLAVRRRHPLDLLAAASFALLQLAQYICLGLTPRGPDTTPVGVIGGFASIMLWFVAPVHFLLADTRLVWSRLSGPGPQPAAPVPPLLGPPPPFDSPSAPDDLQQLGELLRRQAREGGQP